MKISSAKDLKKLFGRDALIRTLVDQIVIFSGDKLPVPTSATIYVPQYPKIDDFQALWDIRVLGLFDEELADVLAAIQALVGGQIAGSNITVGVLATDELIELAEEGKRQLETQRELQRAVQVAQSVKDGLDGSRGEQGPPGPPGRDGKDGRDGVDGRDGQDIDATQTSIFDLQDVDQGMALEKGQVITYDGNKFTNLFIPQVISSISGGSGVAAQAGYVSLDVTNTIDPALGEIRWEEDEHTAVLGIDGNIHNHLGHDIYAWCRNATGATIDKGTAVMFAGTVGASGRVKIAPMVADGTYPGYVFLGFAGEDIPNDTDGNVISYGKLKGVDTTGFTEQSILWCDPATPGGLTETEPTAPNLKLPVAAVISSANNGTLMVRWDTGRRLRDLHDVQITGTPVDGQVLTYVAANNRWEPTNGLTGAVEEAPQNGQVYGRKDAAWVATIEQPISASIGDALTYNGTDWQAGGDIFGGHF